MKVDRIFYSTAGALFLLIVTTGFHSFIRAGRAQGGRVIDPAIIRLVSIHGIAIASWYVLFFVQSLLIAVRKRRLHMTLGWAAVAIGLTIIVTGPIVAIRSVQHTPSSFHFFGILYSRFLLSMLSEIALFAGFLTAGLLLRKRPRPHRALMTLASLSLLAGATSRVDLLYPLFGHAGWVGLFAPVFCIGLAMMLARFAITRILDRTFVAGYALLVVALIATVRLSESSAWDHLSSAVLRL